MRFLIGYAAPLTGPQSIVGIPMLRVVEMAVSDARRDNWDLNVVAVDDQADESVAAEVAQQLCDDASVIAVVGHKNSGPSRAGGAIYAAAGLTQVAQCATDNALTRSGWRTFFRLCADNETQAAVAADYARTYLKPSRVAAVHDGTGYGRPLVDAFAARLKAFGAGPVVTLRVWVWQQDFGPTVDAIRSADADLVYIGATEIEGSKLTIALRAAQIDAQVITSEGGPHNPFPRLAGEAAE
ncbi:MAG: branched-chain amino acid ABC transporter substrate-binding protein, partial [Candidatus Dormibacteraceae bacterium]